MADHLAALSAEMQAALDVELLDVLDASSSQKDRLFGMMHYHMGWLDADLQPANVSSGKRIRPLLCMLCCMAAGGDWKRALPAAAAVELLHNFSLIHDDIEDASPTRRGRPTLWHIWGIEHAINAGDAMFAISHLALNRLSQSGLDPAVTVQALRRFDETCVLLTKGQHADMDFEKREEVSVDEYVEMITGKTAVLLALCAELGALIAGAGEDVQKSYSDFGRNLGLAFQVRDDILGIWGDETVTGKSAATDVETRKKTLPVLYGLAMSKALRSLYDTTENGKNFVLKAVALLDEVGAQQYAAERAAYYSGKALGSLEAAQPSGRAAVALNQLADMLLNRVS